MSWVGRETAPGVRVRVPEPERARGLLEEAGFTVTADGTRLYVDSVADPARITRTLAEQGLFVSELVPDRADLEQVFLRLTDAEGLSRTDREERS